MHRTAVEENSMTVAWVAPAALNGAAADYSASISPSGQSSSWGTDLFATFSGLTAGTRHTVTVTTRTLKGSGYTQQTVEYSTSGDDFYTSQ